MQIGIGVLADGIVNAIIMRHQHNDEYNSIIQDLGLNDRFGKVIANCGGLDPFKEGFYVNSEMLVEPFLELVKQGIIKRKVYDHLGIQQLINEKIIENDSIPPNILELLPERKAIQKVLSEENFSQLQQIGVFKDGLTYSDYEITDEMGNCYSNDLREAGILQHCKTTA